MTDAPRGSRSAVIDQPVQSTREAAIKQAMAKRRYSGAPTKESGVASLGMIPTHWRIARLMHLTPSGRQIMYGIVLPGPDVEEGIPIVKSGNCVQARLRPEFLSRTTREIEAPYARARLRSGDIVYAIRGSIGTAAIVPSDLEGANLTQDAARIAPGAAISPTWLLYAVQSHAVWSQLAAGILGATVKGINIRDLKRPVIPVPPPEEQRTIATFLDRRTVVIDQLIQKKERLIELLQEKRQALITQAVTKGLDPSVPMKESGVTGLGKIPTHWHATPLMHLTPAGRQIMYGIVLPGPDVEGGIPIVKSGNCTQARLRPEFLSRTTPEIEAPYVRARLRPGDIVYAIRGSIGMAAIVPPDLEGANLTQDAARIAPRAEINSRFLLYAVQSHAVWSQLAAGILGATVKGINIRDLKRPLMPVPPREEQDSIVTDIDLAVHRLDAVSSATGESVERLREYRQALISAAVTGQIDVTKEAA